IVPSFDEAWRALAGLYAQEKISGVHRAMINYGAARDFIAFATDHSFSRARPLLDLIRSIDPDHPIAIGAHQLFANQPLLRWDIPRWAKLGDLFTTSIHLSWHFELVDGEVDRPVYLQARLTRDADKSGWTSCYETTGGPVQYSGGFGNAMTPGLMRRLTLLYLAAGNFNVAYWTWNPRPGGWEGGEYGMIDLAGELTPWAQEAGAIARAMARWNHELWESDDQADVAVLTSWDTDAVLCLEPERHDLTGYRPHSSGTPLQAVRSRIGAGRALINARLTFHYVDTRELADASLTRYRAIYAPHLRSVDDQTLGRLLAFVEAGGRLIADVPFAFNDPWGKLRHAGPDTPAAQLLGAWIAAIHDARTQPRRLGEVEISGFFADLTVSGGRVISHFDDGSPAIVEKAHGAGSAVLVGCDLSRICLKPGNTPAERLLAELLHAGQRPAWRCSTPLAWRRRFEVADHYFLVNDGPTKTAILSVFDADYASAVDAITQEPLPLGPTTAVELPERSARWIRFERDTSAAS
ncbi:MAG: beta-galactosidase trimerization domain-containing protein, partial [Phycisphaeraceae bacterium]|nr:beta-galactosidase trimerization domain-containing protein [Phycisphaeraceae bacterium]